LTANFPTIFAEGACFCSATRTSLNLRAQSFENAERFTGLLHKDRARIVTNGAHWCILANEKETAVAQQFVSTFWLQFVIAS
jgi:hypothetical protein